MYIVNKETLSEQLPSTPDFIPAGIHENIEITGIRFDISSNNNKFIEFTFHNSSGSKATHTEYEPVKSNITSDKFGTAEEKYNKKIYNQIGRIKQIITKLIPEEAFNVNATNFEDFCKKTIELVGEQYKNKKLRVKFVYNNKNFTSLPSYWSYQFIESMDIPKEESKIRILGIDKIEKSKADTERYDENPYGLDELNSDKTNDLLF